LASKLMRRWPPMFGFVPPVPWAVMTNRATEAGVDVEGVLIPAGVLDDLIREIVTLGAHGVRAISR